MSRENVETVRRWLASEGMASADQGPEALRSAVAEFCDPDIDYYPARKFSDVDPCHGSEEFSEFIVHWLDAWSRVEWEVQDLLEVGDDRVLGCTRLRAEGRGSGMTIEGDLYVCVWLRHGRMFRIEDHLTLSGALRALGLTGETLEAAGLGK
jgi:SnoaL-like domain